MTPPLSPSDLHNSRVPNIIASVTVLWITSIIAVVLRFTARRKARITFGWDDWLVLFAMALPFSGTCIANFVGVTLGSGKHLEYVLATHPEHVQGFLQYIFAVELLYPWILGPLKCSVLALYVRLFSVNQPFRYYCYFLMMLCVAWAVALELGTAFQCTPVWEAWNPTLDRSRCLNLQYFLVGFNVPNIALDFLILTAPIPLIWRLSLPFKRKMIVSGILMLGVGETVFSIVRLATLTSLDTSDATWDYFGAIVWSTVEQSIGILCVSLPAMAPLMPTWLIGTSRKHSGDDPNRSKSSSNNKNRAYKLQSMDQSEATSHTGYGDRVYLTSASSETDDKHIHDEQGIRRTTEFRIEHDLAPC